MTGYKVLRIILLILIALGLMFWALVLLNNYIFDVDDAGEADQLVTDATATPPQTTPPEEGNEPMPEPTQEPPPPPKPLPPTPEPPPPPVFININNEEAELTEALDRLASRHNCAAASLAAFDGDNTFYTYQYGKADISADIPINDETKFRVASLSKMTTTIGALKLADDGLLDLDGDISDYLGYEVRNPRYPDDSITPRMLMQHTSSIHDSGLFNSSRRMLDETETTIEDLLGRRSSFREHRPGSRYHYSNFAISVLASVCETVSNRLLDDLANDVLFVPLGIDAAYTPSTMQDTKSIANIYNREHRNNRNVEKQLSIVSSGIIGNDHHLAQGNLTISAIDYARILAMLCNGGELGGVRILSENSVREIHKADVNGAGYMQGLAVRFSESAFSDEDIYWHTGSAYGELTQFIYNLETGMIAVVLTTGSDSGRTANGMVNVCTRMSEEIWQHMDKVTGN